MEPADWITPLIGCVGGIVLGLAARLGRFCSLGAIEDASFGMGSARLATWGLAIAIAILGVTSLDALNLMPVASVFYLTNPVPVLSTVCGGFAFGVGMALVGTCGFGALARLGGGDLSGLVVVLVIGMAGYISSSGAIGIVRARYIGEAPDTASETSLGHLISSVVGGTPETIALCIGVTLLGTMLYRLRSERRYIFCGSAVGLVIVAGWAVTAWQNDLDFGETLIRSYSFVRPVGDTMIYLMTSSGTSFSFGAASVLGVIIGAAVGANIKREFRWEACDDARTLKRQILGAALMGVGGVFSLGCTVGQGLSAASVLAISAPVAVCSMMVGAWCGLQWLVNGSIIEPVRDALRLR